MLQPRMSVMLRYRSAHMEQRLIMWAMRHIQVLTRELCIHGWVIAIVVFGHVSHQVQLAQGSPEHQHL